MTLGELRNAVCRHIDENRDAYNETGDECYRAVKEELLHILGLIDTVDYEPVGKDKLTLKELAHELRKIFPRTKYVTVGNNPHKATLLPEQKVVSLFYSKKNKKPAFVTEYIIPNIWGIKDDKLTVGKYSFYSLGIHEFYLGEVVNLDLSEYKDADGNIDYSRCIVEVSE